MEPAQVQAIILDVDGVLTDGRLYFSASGEALKVFHVHDGTAIKDWRGAGGRVALLSGRPSTDALEWVGPMAAIGLGVVILIATVPRRHRDADDEPPEDGPMGDGTQAAGQ